MKRHSRLIVSEKDGSTTIDNENYGALRRVVDKWQELRRTPQMGLNRDPVEQDDVWTGDLIHVAGVADSADCEPVEVWIEPDTILKMTLFGPPDDTRA